MNPNHDPMPTLPAFYLSIHQWLTHPKENNPFEYESSSGLCHNLRRYLGGTHHPAYDRLRVQMLMQFIMAGLDPNHPFESSLAGHMAIKNKYSKSNKARLSWIASHQPLQE